MECKGTQKKATLHLFVNQKEGCLSVFISLLV